MKLWDIVKNVGASALNVALPGAGTAIVSLVNEFLPDDKKLTDSATGHQVENALQGMDPADRAKIIDREFEVDITRIKESGETIRAMLQADQMSAHTTRPKIAYQSFQVTAFATIVIVCLWAYAVGTNNVAMVTTIENGWPFIFTMLGVFIALLYAYFGILRDEHKNRLNSIGGNQPAGILNTLISAIKK